jgi:hypothetical protein
VSARWQARGRRERQQMDTTVTEIADGIYRLSSFVAQISIAAAA